MDRPGAVSRARLSGLWRLGAARPRWRWVEIALVLSGLAAAMMAAAPLAQAAIEEGSVVGVGSGIVTPVTPPLPAAAMHAAAKPTPVDPFTASAAKKWVSPARAVRPAHSTAKLTTTATAHVGMVRLARDAPVGLPAHATRMSGRQAEKSLTVTVVLRRTRQAAFNRYLTEVYDPHSSLHDHFLSQSELASRFGPSLSVFDQVKAWLTGEGFRVVQSPANRLSLTVRGSIARAERTFNTTIATVGRGRRQRYVNARAPAVPRALASQVQAVMGLSDLKEPSAAPSTQTGFQNFNACLLAVLGTAAYTGAGGLVGYVEATLAAASFGLALLSVGITYASGLLIAELGCFAVAAAGGGLKPGLFSASVARRHEPSVAEHRSRSSSAAPKQKIGLLEFDSYRASDVTDWLQLLGDPASTTSNLHEVNVNGGVSAPGAGESEVLVDLDSVLMEVGDTVPVTVYEGSPSTSFVQMFQAMIGDGDTVISNSWSQCEDETSVADADAINSILAGAAASGVTVLNGSGDDGSSCLDGSANTVGVPADSPNATSVGGATPTISSALSVTKWSWWGESGDDTAGSGGYGVSKYFSRPSYQDGLTSAGGRSVPDLAFDADPAAGIEICQADAGSCPSTLLYGGTSLATPLVAAEVADLNTLLGRDVGDLNAALYPLRGTQAFDSATQMGSDFAHVGLGVPDFTAIYEALSGARPGSVSATESVAAALGEPQADGSDQGVVRVELEGANGLPVGGKTVTLTPDAGSSAQVSPSSVTTDATSGSAVFTVTDTTAETVTFTAKDTTDDVTLTTKPSLTFVPPVATNGEIEASQTGQGAATITVNLVNAQGRPAVDKTVSLSENGGGTIAQTGDEATTDDNGVATFTVTDSNAETDSFTATDVTDGNLPVPGSASVNFNSTSDSCDPALPTATSPYTVSSFATGVPFNEYTSSVNGVQFGSCNGPMQPAFDASGNMYLSDQESGQIFKIGAGGGPVDSGDALPDADFSDDTLSGVTVAPDGDLYAALEAQDGNFSDQAIVQLNPQTGAVERTVADATTGLGQCPAQLAADPISGDLFVTDFCNFGNTTELERISDPAGASPTVSSYATLPATGFGSDGITFDRAGTIYVALGSAGKVVSVSGTNVSGSPTVTTLDSSENDPRGVAIASTNSSGQATALYVVDIGDGTIVRLSDLSSPTPTRTVIATSSDTLYDAATSPDGCTYVDDVDRVLELSDGSACSGVTTPAPTVTLGKSGSASEPVGGSVTYTAKLSDFSSDSDVPVHFDVDGANSQVKLVDTDADGVATFTERGVLSGADLVTASALSASTVVSSATVRQDWVTGDGSRDVTFLDLNASQLGGPAGRAATLRADLYDVSQVPETAIASQPVTMSLDGKSCTATTNGAGLASCSVAPVGGVGLDEVVASYAGSSTYTAATASNTYALGAVGLGGPRDVGLPKISGTAQPGHRLSCSEGSWSNLPTSYAYAWSLNGKRLKGATSDHYTVTLADQAGLLACTVTASSVFGSASATSARVRVIDSSGTLGCPKPTGSLHGITLGKLKLGMTRAKARRTLKRYTVSRNNFDKFCLYAGFGIRAGYPSTKLERSLSKQERAKVKGRVILILTANSHYSYKGVKPGAKLTEKLKRKLHLGKVFKVGKNDWYFASGKSSDLVFKVQNAIIDGLGIADKQLLRTRPAQSRFIRGFPNL